MAFIDRVFRILQHFGVAICLYGFFHCGVYVITIDMAHAVLLLTSRLRQ